MTTRLLVFVLFLLCTVLKSHAQMPFYHYFEDTIRPGYRISGTFNRIDTKLGAYQSTMPTFWRPALDIFDLSNTYISEPVSFSQKRFSSIPHVGLQYSFGSNVSQQGGINYTQALTKNQFIQINYLRQTSNGAIRNAAMERTHFELAHLLRKKRYASQLEILFEGSKRGANGGLLGDTIDPDLPLEFQAVEKDDAELTQRYFHTDWKNFFSFTQDSLIKTGLYIAPHYQIENRRYTETGDIATLYGLVNTDSARTNDYWERSEIGGVAGYFFHTKHFSINGGLKTAYWDFDNPAWQGDSLEVSVKSDTLEVGIVSDLVIDLFNAVQLKANGKYTFIGAEGEKNLDARLSYRPAFADLSFRFSFKQAYPANYQRAYNGNTINYSWQTKTLITTTRLEAFLQSTKRYLPVTAGVSFCNVLNNPFFLNNSWRQDTLSNLSFLKVFIRADVKWGKLFFQPFVRVQQSTFDFVPSLQANVRFGFDGFLFKAKKLRATIGIDAGYTSAFSLLDYIPMMDTYMLPANGSVLKRYEAMPKLHVFTQFELGFFRWYIRVENIEQTFLPTTNQEAIGYPVVPMQLRIGLSWDLFN